MGASAADGFDVLNVIGRYFQFRDAKDWDGVRSLLADMVTVEYGALLPLEGCVDAETLERAMGEMLNHVPLTQHMVTTPVVDIEGDAATARFHLQTLHHHPGLGHDERRTDWTLYARDAIGLERTASGWKVASERLTVLHQTGNTDFVSEIARLAGHKH